MSSASVACLACAEMFVIARAAKMCKKFATKSAPKVPRAQTVNAAAPTKEMSGPLPVVACYLGPPPPRFQPRFSSSANTLPAQHQPWNNLTALQIHFTVIYSFTAPSAVDTRSHTFEKKTRARSSARAGLANCPLVSSEL